MPSSMTISNSTPYETWQSRSWQSRLVLALVFLFPVVTTSVKDAGSAIYLLLFVASLFYAWPCWKEIAYWEKRVLLGFVVFFLILLLSMINTEEYAIAMRKIERFLRLLAIVPIYLLLRRVGTETAKALLFGAALGSLVLALQGLYFRYIVGDSAVNGVYHKIIFGDTAVLFAAIVAAGLICLKPPKWQVFVGILCIFAGLYASVLSLTRQSWLLIPLLIIVWLWLIRKTLSGKTWAILAAGLLAVTIIGTVWMPANIKQGIDTGVADLKRYETDKSASSSWGARLNMWRDAWTLFKGSPVLGVGIGDYTLERQRLIDANLARKGYGYGHAHSIYMHALATTGIVGFVGLIICLFYLPLAAFYKFWGLSRTDDERFYTMGGITTIVAFAAFGFSEGWLVRNPFVNDYSLFVIVFMSSIAMRVDNQHNLDQR